MKQQTAVEWLFQKMTEQGTNPYWDMRFIQAKQMMKDQIIEAFDMGTSDKDRIGKEYFNQQYENNTQNK